MSKKLLCASLVLVMLFFAIPVTAAESKAGEPVYSTSFGTVNNEANNCQNLPTVGAGNSIIYHGNWVPISYPKGAYSDPGAALPMDAPNANLDGHIGPASTVAGGGTAGMKITGQAVGGNTNYHAYYGQILSTSASTGGIRYTVEKTGTIDIILDAVGNMTRLGRNSKEFRYGIFRNGEMIWPKNDGTALADTLPLHEFLGGTAYENLSYEYPVTADGVGAEAYLDITALSNLFVREGDVLDFLVEMVPEDGAWYGMWEGQGNIFFPTINYMSELRPTEVNATVKLGDGFSVALSFAHIDVIYQDVRVSIDGTVVEANEDGEYVYDGIAAKDIANEFDWMVTATLDGELELLDEGTLSVAGLLYDGFVKDKEDSALRNLAIAALNYGAAAQEYFGTRAPLANEQLSESEKTVTLAETYTDAEVIAEAKEDAAVRFSWAALLINDTVDVKLVVNTDNSIGNYRMQISSSADFADASLVSFENCQGAGYYKAILDGIAPGAWDDVIYARVVDVTKGNAVVSDTFRYSAAIYYARMQNDAELAPMLRAMLAVNEAAAAYTAQA